MFQWFSRARSKKVRVPFRPRLELLESRTTPSTFTVTNVNNSGTGSLRQAMLNANANPGLDAIHFSFSIAGDGPIRLLSDLPDITSPVSIDGSRLFVLLQPIPGVGGRPLVEIDGNGVSDSLATGIELTAGSGGSTIKGLVIHGFNHQAISIRTNNNTIQDCWIGTSFDGNSGGGGTQFGIRIREGVTGNRIGGTTAQQRNVISNCDFGIANGAGGASNNVIQGNFIGTNATGTAALPNISGILLQLSPSTGNQILDNVISGNFENGIVLSDSGISGTIILRNRIGVAADGVTPLPNQRGIFICNGAHDNAIGSTSLNSGNIIGFNTINGVLVGNLPGAVGSFGTPAGTGNSILGNSIFASPGGFIDLGPANGATLNDQGDVDTGPNNLQNRPNFTGAGNNATQTVIQGGINSNPNSTILFQFFGSKTFDALQLPQDMTFLTSTTLTTNNIGDVLFNVSVPAQPVGSAILGTATNTLTGDTSEFNIIFVANTAPMIRDDVLTPEINEGQQATLSGRLVDPDPGDQLSLVVNWGDGSPVQTFHPGLDPFAFKHRYADNGTYDVNFTWIDNHGGFNTRTRQVIVDNVAPILRDFDLKPDDPNVHQKVKLTGRIVDPGADTFKVTIDWGDGTIETIDRAHDGPFQARHRYQRAGRFTIHLTITDDDGGVSETTHSIRVG